MERHSFSLPRQRGGTLLKWKINLHDNVEKRQVLAEYTSGQGELRTLKSPSDGKIVGLLVKEGQNVQPGEKVVDLERCPHPVEFGGLCVICGKDMTRISEHAQLERNRQTSSVVVGAEKVLKFTTKEMKKKSREHTKQLKERKKLALVLDLDHTLVHATQDQRIGALLAHPHLGSELHTFIDPVIRRTHYVKLRPGVRDFLDIMKHFYELHIYTHGSRQYAERIADILEIGRAVQQECRDRSRMPSSA
eukprot:TRINITY_DN77079_c0_g2_i2.p1 TRINITY_DN77079_c0_g2~~TRINITY_DN77079_c0_g2_i2.p1  ORF type:complete len:248 (-),score=39.01 TRINITY_DN77079_c0_g2_i2:11-754(-)